MKKFHELQQWAANSEAEEMLCDVDDGEKRAHAAGILRSRGEVITTAQFVQREIS